MKNKKIIKRVTAFLLCITFLAQICEVQAAFSLLKENELPGEAAVYWNPGGNQERSNYDSEARLATKSNSDGKTELATKSNAKRQLKKGSDRANGLSPDTAVKSLNTAISRAEKLSRQMDIEMTDIVIYAMNPMIIPQGKSYTLDGKDITVAPWEGRGDDEVPIFIVDGGKLSLNHIIIQPENDGADLEESAMIYISSGTVQLGEQVEVYGTFVLDYTQPENEWSLASVSDASSSQVDSFQEPLIELTNLFDPACDYKLDLRIPDDRERDVIAIKTLHADRVFTEDFMDAFTVSGTTEEWEILVEDQIDGLFRDTTSTEQDAVASVSDASSSNAGQRRERRDLQQKSLIARRITNAIPDTQISGRLWLDENADGVMEEGEQGITDYPVSVYAVNDRSTAIQTVKTQEDGTYWFSNLQPGSYVVGIISETVDSMQYLLPAVGITNDNKFEIVEIGEGLTAACSEAIAITTDVAAEHVNAGLYQRAKLSLFNGISFIHLPLGGNILDSGHTNMLVVMEADGDPLNGYYQAYTANESGLRSALYGIYERDEESADYIMYLGSDITSLPVNIFSNTSTATGTGNVTFASLQGRLNTLVITGHKDDLVTDTPATAAPTNNRLISVSTAGERYFGSNIILRNIRHTFNAGTSSTNGIYMNGYSLTLGGDSWQTAATRYFGGSSTGSVTPSEETAAITVYSTGSGYSYFIGGMRTGTLNGNAAITINGTSGNTISVRGGGLGISSSNPANITGSVTNTITGMAAGGDGLERFLGGVEYGDVGGQITNTISGNGRFVSSDNGTGWVAGTSRFVGGSLNGNVGSDSTLGGAVDTSDLSDLADTNDYIIKNNIDTSNYTNGRANYCGSNHQSGIVKGNVVNIVKAGANDKGAIGSFSGGAGINAIIGGSWSNTFTVNTSTTKVTNIEAGLAAAKNASDYQLYGNITTVIRGGSLCYAGDNGNWFRGVGWGYMEGNAYTELGTEDIVYANNYNSYSYSTTNTSQGYGTVFDLVGGGGTIASNNSFCIKGDTTLVTKNVLARWTYGGSFGGVQVGDSLLIHQGGILDTCEGTGYNSYIHVGDGRAEVHGGQVDWFLSGGGWNDSYQDGNVSVEVFDKPNVIINASMGGTYGLTTTHAVSGDSTIVVHGGNFSGTARTAVSRGFSAGPSYMGYIRGNASVTIDLRSNQHGFSIEPRDSISGGRRWDAGASSYLGTDENNTITLNILTDDSQTDLLNGLDIYGDCSGTTASIGNTRAGKIIINVNAPNANIGNLYATSYLNISGGTLRRDVQINLVSAATIIGLCSGNGTENITNTVAQASEVIGKKAVINVGPQSTDPNDMLGEKEVGQTADGLPHRINISTDGIIGFTAMDIHKRLLVAQSGHIKNGLSATVTNHGTTYHNFGTVTLHAGNGMEGAGLGIASPDASFIAGTAYVEGKGQVYVQSTGQVNQIVFTDIITSGINSLTWLKVGDVSADTNLQTNWFGVSSGWRVITLNPDKTKARDRITPVNFRGLEESTGKTFIGDSDTHFSGDNGYAVAILGSVYTWEVTEGNGKVSHNVPVSTTAPSSGQTVNAYGTVPANTPSVEGSIAVPSPLIPDTVPYPVFSFIPDIAFDECVKNVEIYGSDRYVSSSPHNYQISQSEMYQTKTWMASGDDKDYSFDIIAMFAKGETNVYARDVIITETQAAAISSADDIISYTQASGFPLLRHNITAQLLAEIRTSLAVNQRWRPHLVSYTAGNSEVNRIDTHVIVVKDGTVVSADRQYAIYANDATMMLEDAQALSGQAALDSGYTNAVVILANGTTAVPDINGSAISDITGSTVATTPKNVPVIYTYAPDDQSAPVTKPVTVRVQGLNEITVSKRVEGDYVDKTKRFSFTIYFWDSDGIAFAGGTQLSYTGSIIAGSGAEVPADGTLTLDSEGKAVFELKHGQQITIVDPVLQGKVRIIETADPNYNVSFTDSNTAGSTSSMDTGIVNLGAADRTFGFINTRIRTAVYVDGISGNDEHNEGYVPTEPVRTLEKAYEKLRAAGGNVIYVVGTVNISETTTINSSQYLASTEINLSSDIAHVDIRRFATPLAGEPASGILFDEKYEKDDFLGVLFNVENGVVLTIGEGVYFDGHYNPKTSSEYTNEFYVARYLKVLSPLIQVESGAALILQEDARLNDNYNTKDLEDGETRVHGGAIYNNGRVELSGAAIQNNNAAKGACIYQNGTFEIISNPYGIEGQEIYLTTVNSGSMEEPVWGEDHTLNTAVWLQDDLKLNINMDHAVAGRPVVRYTAHTDVDPQWENYTLDESVQETLFLVENEADNTLLELQDWRITDISIPNEIFLVIYQGRAGEIGVKRADSNDFVMASPAYTISNRGYYETKVSLTGFINQNADVGIVDYETMTLVASPSDAVSDSASRTDLYLAIQGTDTDDAFSSLPETSLYDFHVEGEKQQEMGVLESGEEADFVFTGTASNHYMSYYMDSQFPYYGSDTTEDDRIAHLRNKNLNTGETSANHARAMYKMTYRVELIPPRR